MRHADEGLIHAYLDGALAADAVRELEDHVATCPDCAARLDEERALHDRAAGILRGAAPAAQPAPPFEAIRARARREQARSSRAAFGKLAALGWAATILLAVGAGWMMRGMLQTERRAAIGPAATETTAAAEPRADALRQQGAAEGGAAGAEQPTSPTAARQEANRPSPAVQGKAAAPARESEELAAAPAARAPIVLEDQAVAALGALQADAGAQQFAENAGAAQRDEAVRARRAQPVAAEPSISGVAPAAIDTAQAHGVIGGILLDDPGARASFASRFTRLVSAASWSPADSATAERRLGAPLRRLPNADIRSFSVSTLDGQPAVRSDQTMPAGAAVEVVQWRADSVATERGDAILLRAPLPADSLIALLLLMR